MISRNTLIALLCCSALAIPVFADPVNTNLLQWGSLEQSVIVDSYGNPLPPENFTFDLGAFVDGFTPDETNVADWAANWRSFNIANYSFDNDIGNPVTGVFGNEYEMYDSGNFNAGSFGFGDFEDLGISRNAYIWVYNDQTPEPGSEWFLARATSWVFPTLAENCCDNNTPIQWSMGDLWDAGVVPVWGGQGGEEGSGLYSNFNPDADLQTFTFIPEPSSALLVAFAGIMTALRRNREPKAA